MKKNLIALAVAGAVAAPMAAQADATIYGVFDVEVAQLDDGQDSGLFVMGRNTRLGFKGSEDLGNGLKAIWQVENDLDVGTNQIGANNSATTWARRNTYVGLAGGFGAVILGRYDTPYKLVGRKVDLFGHHLGDARGITGWNNHDQRLDNVVAYKTPNMGGFGVLAAVVTADNTTANSDIAAVSINGTYAKGPLFVGAAYQSIDNAAGDNTAWRIAASYKMGAFRVVGLYDSSTDDSVNTDYSTIGIGGSFKTGAHTIKAQFYTAEQDTGTTPNAKADLLAVGWDYGLSKKTTVYAEYAAITNKDGANRSMFSNTVVPAANDDPSGLGVGLRIKF